MQWNWVSSQLPGFTSPIAAMTEICRRVILETSRLSPVSFPRFPFECECGEVAAEIPAIMPLMQLIARDIVAQPTSLSGDEIRFLRKRLGKKQLDLAKELGVEAETLSRYENGHLQISEPNDKLLRLYYAFA